MADLTSQDFDMFAGDTKNLVVTVTDNSGSIVDLTGGQVTWVLKRNLGASPLVTKTSTVAGQIDMGGTSGQFTVHVLPADTTGFSGMYYHEAVFTDVAGNVSTVMTGRVVINQS